MEESRLEIKSKPTDDTLHFMYDGQSRKMTFSICDAGGNIVNEGKVVPGEPVNVPMERFRKGVYWIYINDQDRIVSKRFTRS